MYEVTEGYHSRVNSEVAELDESRWSSYISHIEVCACVSSTCPRTSDAVMVEGCRCREQSCRRVSKEDRAW